MFRDEIQNGCGRVRTANADKRDGRGSSLAARSLRQHRDADGIAAADMLSARPAAFAGRPRQDKVGHLPRATDLRWLKSWPAAVFTV